MSTDPFFSPRVTALASPAPAGRIEYLGFQDVPEHREYWLRTFGSDGWTDFQLRIPVEAFRARRVSLQDGPDVCYQRLLHSIAIGETATPGVITVDDAYLASYREVHTPVPKRRGSWTPPTPSSPPSSPSPTAMPRRPPRAAARPLPVAPPVASDAEPTLAEGQRVSHAVFGVGVTTSSNGGHTVVHFDNGGSRTFVTSLLAVDVLSAPHTWETGPRGHNRPLPDPQAAC